MEQWYELWDSDGGNLVADFNSRARAVHFVRRYMDTNSEGMVLSWTLTRETGQGDDPEVIASGPDLIALAHQPLPAIFAGVNHEVTVRGASVHGDEFTSGMIVSGNRIGWTPDSDVVVPGGALHWTNH